MLVQTHFLPIILPTIRGIHGCRNRDPKTSHMVNLKPNLVMGKGGCGLGIIRFLFLFLPQTVYLGWLWREGDEGPPA